MNVNDTLAQVTSIALSGLHCRQRPTLSTGLSSNAATNASLSTGASTNTIPNLTPSNNYCLKTTYPHYTPPSTALEHLFMEATRCRSSHPALEILVDVWNRGVGVNGVYPPYQLGVSGEDGVLSVYRSFKGEDLNSNLDLGFDSDVGDGSGRRRRRERVEWSDVMFGVWRGYSCSCCTDSTNHSVSSEKEGEGEGDNDVEKEKDESSGSKSETGGEAVRFCGGGCGAAAVSSRVLRYIAIPEVNNEEVKLVARYAFGKEGLDFKRDILVVRDATKEKRDGLEWTLFDAFLGTASVKAVQRMAVDHRNEMGNVIPSRVLVKYSRFEYPGQGDIWLPNVLVEMKRDK
ncbi:hypothetical protein TWF694_011055 [Orbilia ellipsospora]|uniref:Uncharacterized protein n=1 Tax=Orbilia ellipsospora TaxID=2528407 RepID=A0AAV9XE50_9PEZI